MTKHFVFKAAISPLAGHRVAEKGFLTRARMPTMTHKLMFMAANGPFGIHVILAGNSIGKL